MPTFLVWLNTFDSIALLSHTSAKLQLYIPSSLFSIFYHIFSAIKHKECQHLLAQFLHNPHSTSDSLSSFSTIKSFFLKKGEMIFF